MKSLFGIKIMVEDDYQKINENIINLRKQTNRKELSISKVVDDLKAISVRIDDIEKRFGNKYDLEDYRNEWRIFLQENNYRWEFDKQITDLRKQIKELKHELSKEIIE